MGISVPRLAFYCYYLSIFCGTTSWSWSCQPALHLVALYLVVVRWGRYYILCLALHLVVDRWGRHYILWHNILWLISAVGTIYSVTKSGELVAILLGFLLGFIIYRFFHLFSFTRLTGIRSMLLLKYERRS